MKKSINVSDIKRANYIAEADGIVSTFRNALNKHFEVVYAKSKNLIDTRWEV